MRWGRRYNDVRPARPKAHSLKTDEAEQIATRLKAAIDCSPVLRALGLHVRSLRSRFHLEWRWDPGAYTIKPNQSQDIATAETWLAKRNWESWG